MPHPTPLHSRIRTILLTDWDPTNASQSPHAQSAYDPYIDPLISLVRSGGDEESVIDFLQQRQQEIMCFPGLDRGPLRRPARLIVQAIRESHNPDLVPPRDQQRQ